MFSFPADDGRSRFGGGRVAVTVGSLLDDEHWHSVHVERFNRQVNLTVDSHAQHFQTGGEGHSLEVDYEVSPRGGGGAEPFTRNHPARRRQTRRC